MNRHGLSCAVLLATAVSFLPEVTCAEDPPSLVAMRTKFEVEKQKRLGTLMQSYGQALQRTMTELTQAGNLDDALAYKQEIEAVAAQLAAGADRVEDAKEGKRPDGALVLPRNRVDLIKLIDVARDGERPGSWVSESGLLVCMDRSDSQLKIPYEPPEEYDFTVVFRQPELNYDGLTLAMPNGKGGIFGVELDQREISASIDGYFRREPNAHKELTLRPGEKYTLTIEVRRGNITANINGERMFRYGGVRDNLTLRSGEFLPGRLGLEVGNPTLISKLEVTEMMGKGKVLTEGK